MYNAPATFLPHILTWTADTDLSQIEADVSSGGQVIVLLRGDDRDGELPRLAGVKVRDGLPYREWFVTLAQLPVAARLDGEVPVTSHLALLDPTDGDTEVIATTSVGYNHQATITRRRIGAGTVIACGVSDEGALAGHPTLNRLLSRLVGPDHDPVTADLGVAVVGYGPYGGMGYAHGLACSETDGLRLAAAVDPAPDRLDAARSDFGELVTAPTAEGILGEASVDIAVIATPPVLHADLAVQLLEAGKHVVVEKPMALTGTDAQRMIDTARANDRVLTVHQSRRWDTDWLALRRAVDTGMIGDVFNIETFVGSFEHPCRAWHSEESISGGAVYDWGSHHIDWIQSLFGAAPARVSAIAHRRVWLDSTNDDQIDVHLVWDDGRTASFRQSDVAALRPPKFFVQGTGGSLAGHYQVLSRDDVVPGRGFVAGEHHHAEAPVHLTCARYEGGYGLVESTLPPVPAPGWGFHRNLADHLLLGEPLAVPPHESASVVATLEAAHRSAKDGGRTVELGAA